MVTLKEYEIYLKVKKFIEAEGCDEADLIPRLINGIRIIPAYVPLIIESDDMEPTKYIIPYWLLQEIVGSLNKRSFMPIRIGKLGGFKVFKIEWLLID